MVENLSYTAVALDRAAHLRRDEAWIDARLTDPATRVVALWQSLNLIDARSAEPKVVFLSAADGQALVSQAEEVIFLGLDGITAYAAVDISSLDEAAAADIAAGGEFIDLRRLGALMGGPEASILAYARGMVHWHRRHRFCSVCGQPTQSRDGGHVRFCGGDNSHMHFPRTDPAVIMLVAHDDPQGRGPACLLGRQSRWVEGMYSTLAGFVDPGETLEQAVAREVFEESGIVVRDVRYQASQPWPFPSSLMLGFRATAETTAITIDAREIEDARWFTPDEVKSFGEWGEAPEGEMRLPRKDSVSRWLIESWLEDIDD